MPVRPALVKEFAVPRVVSFIVLLAILLLMGAMFFQVMASFVVPLFLAAVLVVMFKPLHMWYVERFPRHPRVSALATTISILLVALLPTAYLGWNAYRECRGVIAYLKQEENRQQLIAEVNDRAQVVTQYTGIPVNVEELIDEVQAKVGEKLLGSVKGIGWVLISTAIMIFSLYYFFLDGPNMIAAIMRMSPLDDEYERELLEKFATVSRAVVVASLASAVAQGLLAGIGFYFALNAGAPIFLMTMGTMVLAIIPFVGAAAMWIPTALWIYFFQTVETGDQITQGDPVAGISLAVYGVCVISAIDNLIKPLVLHGQSNLHPLLALLSILGGVQVLGPIGILIGPMLVAFFQALLNMVNKELHRMGGGSLSVKHGARGAPTPLPDSTQVEAEAAVAGGGLLQKLVSAVEKTPTPKPASPRRDKRRRK
jgi:predicted PurR-regulated permease PerM